LTPTFWGRGEVTGVMLIIFGKSVLDFLQRFIVIVSIACIVSSQIAEMHSKFQILRWHSPFTPNIRGLRARDDPW
jgi:hypothetical protein